ncbi:MAG: hypothetical protein JRD89_00995 [Deltaproteobacteria bacterium]|nr:hypothetical protein [Deltaproteobacteria bacterium]
MKDMAIRPTEEVFKRLVELEVATIRKNKYTYSPAFEVSVHALQERRPGRFKQLSLGRKVATAVAPLLITHVSTFKNRRNAENLMVAHVCLLTHIERLNLKVDKSELRDLTYAAWYLNDHEPEVWSK